MADDRVAEILATCEVLVWGAQTLGGGIEVLTLKIPRRHHGG